MLLNIKNKAPITNFAKKNQTPVFQIVIRKPAANSKAITPTPKPQKRNKIFSIARDARKMEKKHNPETFFHACALL
jgi:hypothetical protein